MFDEIENDDIEEKVDISDEMGQFDVKAHEILPKLYLSYALSVIKDRSLPDIRDGLKPVARRILYSMNEMGLKHNKPTRKSARIVGDVMGRLHPHSDGSIYGAAVRIAQPFATRYPLIIGQGNFGSLEDPPAAMRYTEMKLSHIAEEVLADLDKETVDMMPNFDGTIVEPKVLPTKLPIFLLNGSIGIAVGMATNAAPHNLTEIINALLVFVENEDISLPELMMHIKGPDFPSGAYMFNTNIQQIYETGRGSVTLRAKAEIFDNNKKQCIIISELPYQVDKSKLIAKIAQLYQEKKYEGIDGIVDIRDESDKTGTRVIIELRKGVKAKTVLNTLYRRTELQTKYSILMRALVNNIPQLVSLKDVFWHFIDHRKNVIIRRTEYDLRNAQKKAHILQGFLIAFDNIEALINDVKSSSSNEITYLRLRKYSLSDEQIKAILELRIQKLAQFERSEIVNEYTELQLKIEQLQKILSSEENVLQVIKDELQEIKDKYSDSRKTKLINVSEDQDNIEIKQIEEIQDDDVIVTVTRNGLVKRTPITEYRIQNVKGRGLIGVDVKYGDYVESMFQLSTRDATMVFTNKGNCYKMNVYDIPSLGRTAAGSSILNILNMNEDEKVIRVILMPTDLTNKSFLLVSRKGQIKKVDVDRLKRPRSTGTRIFGLSETDELVDVVLIDKPNVHILLVTRCGMAIRFEESAIRSSGKNSSGVRAIKLVDDNCIISVNIFEKDKDCEQHIMMVTEKGYSKKSVLSRFRMQRRGGKGIICMEVSDLTGKIVSAGIIKDEKEQCIVITEMGILIRLRSSQIRLLGRRTRGSRIQNLQEGDKVAAVAFLGVVSEDDEKLLVNVEDAKTDDSEVIDDVDDDSDVVDNEPIDEEETEVEDEV
jgi:DNA gyrase subunit A